MKSDAVKELALFVVNYLENGGAIIEKNEHGFEALLPKDLSEVLETSEYLKVDVSGDTAKTGLYTMNYGSALVEKVTDAVCKATPLFACQFQEGYLKKEGFERLINHQFVFSNAKGKIENQAVIKTRYLLLTFRYTAQSDEQKHGLLELAFHLETGACIPRMAEAVFAPGNQYIESKNPILNKNEMEGAMQCIKRHVSEILSDQLKTFHETMIRRFQRDAQNLEEYYDALEKEMEKNLRRHSLSERLAEERREKIALLPDELKRKQNDLFKKYAIKVSAEPCAAMLIDTKAVKIFYHLNVGKNQKTVSLLYNPIVKSIDPVVCDGCKKSASNIHFCPNLHFLCVECLEKCPLC